MPFILDPFVHEYERTFQVDLNLIRKLILLIWN